MTASVLLLAVLLATLARTQTVFEGRKSLVFFRSFGNLLLLLLPLAAIYVMTDLGNSWRNYFFHTGFALSAVLLVAKIPEWEKRWPLAVVWPMLPLIYTDDQLSLWLAMIAAEFLLLLAYHGINPVSNYHKYGFLRLLVIFQFFVFEQLFLQARPQWAGEILTIALILLYVGGLIGLLTSLKKNRLLSILFLVVYLQYGVMVLDKILTDAFRG
jgi:hypothetical protein